MATYEEITIDQGADVAIELHLVDVTGAAKKFDQLCCCSKDEEEL